MITDHSIRLSNTKTSSESSQWINLPATVSSHNNCVSLQVLVDSEADDNLIDEEFVPQMHIAV